MTRALPLVVFLLFVPRSSAVVDGTERAHQRTRFTAQTSHVWRYRAPFERRDLSAVPNNNPHPEPTPHRDHPTRLALDAAGETLYVTLPGAEGDPGRHVAVVDVASSEVVGRVEVGLAPYGVFRHPGGRYLVVTNELSNYATVIDTRRRAAVGEIPLDYYCQGLAFSPDGRRAWVANRYLDQVLVVDIDEWHDGLRGRVRVVGGFDERAFFGGGALAPELVDELRRRGHAAGDIERAAARTGGLNDVLRARCGRCHARSAGHFLSGPDPVANFLSAVENAVGGQPLASPLVRAVVPRSVGGFGDRRRGVEFHAGGALFEAGDPDLERLLAWISAADRGPGIPVGNPGAHPKDVVLSPDGRHLFVGNTGTMDVAIIDVESSRLVGALYLQSLASHLAVVRDPRGDRDLLVVATLGAGFGATKARDPDGAETWDRDHPAAQFAVLRDASTTDPLPLARQPVLGPFDAVDGTWNFKMRDIQNDLVVFDLSRLEIPPWRAGAPLDYLVRAGTYEAHPEWVRYTSDTAEATTGDVKGDVPPVLQRVHGAFPEWIAVAGERLYVGMAGSFEVVEWSVDAHAPDPALRLEPLRAFQTGLRPVGVAVGPPGTPAAGRLFVANQLDETVSVIDRSTGARATVVVGDLTRPALDTDAEKGALVAHSALFSSDGDTSCLHCHYRDTGDGRAWGAGEVIGQDARGHQTPGGTLGIPQMRNVYALQPFYFEGTHRLAEGQGADINEPMSSVDFDRPIWAGDFTAHDSVVPESERRPQHEELKERVEIRKLGSAGYDLDARRDAFVRAQALRWYGAGHDLADLYRFMAAWMGNATRLLPNPFDREHPAVRRGERIFNDSRVMCGVCHAAPEFTNKTELLTHNDRRALPQLTTMTRRDASYTLAGVRAVERANGRDDLDLHPADRGRVEAAEGSFTTMQLRGLFDRPPVFLHHGRARSLREVLATPDHPGLRRYRLPVLQGPEEVRPGRREAGFNELTRRTPGGPLHAEDQTLDTHGGTSHLTPGQLDDLVRFVTSIE